MKIIKAIKVKIENDRLKKKIKNIGKNVFLGENAYVIGKKYIQIGDNFSAFANLRMEAIDEYWNFTYQPILEIGNNVSFGNGCHIGCINKITISDGVLLGSYVLIEDHSHGQT